MAIYMNSKRTVLITGCSSGFGKSTAAHFLARDWNVIATMRSPKSELFDNSDQLLVTSLDVTKSESISDAISKGIDRFGKIDAVVNNAGIGFFVGAQETTRTGVGE